MAKLWGSQQDFSKIPILGLVPESSVDSSPPSSPVDGQLWFDETAGRLKVREGGAWVLASRTGAELAANKGQAGGYASLDGSTKVPIAEVPTGQTGTTVALGNDARFTDSRTPTGAAGGDLTGSTYPNPVIADDAVTLAKIADAIKDPAAGTTGLRSLGTGAQQAMPGNTTLSSIAAPTADIALAGFKFTGAGTPTADDHFATKSYVDLARQGLRSKAAVKVATTGAITLSGTQTIDDVAVGAGDRVLVKNQADASTNGIYTAASGAWARADDADTFQELQDGAVVFVQQGTENQNTTWAQGATLTALSDPQSWFQQGAAASVTPGAGLVANGSAFDVNPDGSTIEVVGDQVRVKALGITNGHIAAGTIDLTAKVTGILPIANGGTGADDAAEARSNLGALTKYAANLGALTAGVEATVTHNLGTEDVGAWFELTATGQDYGLEWRRINANSIGVTADVAHASGDVRVTVMG